MSTASRSPQPAVPGAVGHLKANDAASAEKYLYCIIACDGPRQFTIKGIGERGDPVYTVNFRDLAAVVSDSPYEHYESTRRNMMAHMRVLDEVMAEHTVVPIRFGSLAPTEEAVRHGLLEARQETLRALLEEFAGRVELGLKAFWYEDVMYREVIEENPEIRRLRDALSERSLEDSYYERIRIGEMVEAALEVKRERESGTILERLSPLAHKVQVNDCMSERMVLNAAFLVDRRKESAFDEAVHTLDKELGERLLFKCVGPVAPYNFADIRLPSAD